MARTIGQVKSLENGMFYVRKVNGDVHQLKAGEMISEGDHVYGSYSNDANAKIVIDVLLEGAGDLVLAGDGALQFDNALMAAIFSHNEAVVHVNSLQEGMALAAAAEAAIEKKVAMGEITEAGDETAAGDALTDTERAVDTFAVRDGAITDVTTDLRSSGPSVAETAARSMEATLVGSEAPTPPPPPPPPPVEANAPSLDVALGEAEQLVTPVYSNSERYNLHTHNSTTGNLEFDGSATSVTIELKSYKTDVDDGQILLKDKDGNVIETINIDSLFSDADPHNQPVTIAIDTPFYAMEIQNFVNAENINSEFKIEGINADMVSYQYPLEIIDASLSDSSEMLGDVIVTGLPAGALLTHDMYDDMTVPEDGTVTFGSDTDYTSWTMTVPSELPDDTSIVASLTSTESDGSSATTYVGVYGDNVIIGSEGADSLEGREGNDTLVFDAEDTLIDGGVGTDTLILTGDTDIDFNTWESSSLKNIEVIDLTGGEHGLSNLSLSDVVNMTDNNNIFILGDTGDKVDFLDANGWEISTVTPTLTQNINGVDYTFDVYVNSDDPTVTVHVEQAITDSILP